MPMVELRGRNQPAQWPEADPHIGVKEQAMSMEDSGPDADGLDLETEQSNRNERSRLGERLIEEVYAMGRKPIQLLDAVVDGVKAPEQRNPMESAVRKIEPDVGNHDDLADLNPGRLCGNRCR